MINLKNFKIYVPSDDEKKSLVQSGVIFIESENNVDWYDALLKFSEDTVKIMYDNDGIICSFSQDASTLFPVGMNVAEVDSVPEGLNASGSWIFNGQAVAEKTLTSEDYQEKAEVQRQNRLAEANNTIADWRTELQLNIISDDDKASLIKWMAYIKAVKALDLTGVTNEADYNAIAWPEMVR
ncbi:tail fiber assembly protein [Erwinia amylovora]